MVGHIEPQADLLRVNESHKKILEAEIAGYRAEAMKQDKAIMVRQLLDIIVRKTTMLCILPCVPRGPHMCKNAPESHQ